ncbi:MAG: hypothetical protein WCS67_01535 [Bacteroidales bacterium]
MDNSHNAKEVRPDGHYVFVKYITRNGRRIYPKHGKAFRFWVKA